MFSYYASGNITPKQLTELVDIYHGKKNFDLNSKISVDKSRVKAANQVTPDFIVKLEKWIAKIECKENNFIYKTHKDELLMLINANKNNFSKDSAEFLLCKRILTLVDPQPYPEMIIKPKIVFEITADALYSFLLSPILTLHPGLVLLAIVIYFHIQDKFAIKFPLTDIEMENNTSNNQNDENKRIVLQQKCDQYSKTIGLSISPKIYLGNINNIGTFETAGENIILIGKSFSSKFDVEELFAAIAHEIGHIKSRDLWSYFFIHELEKFLVFPIIPFMSKVAPIILKELGINFFNSIEGGLIILLMVFIKRTINHHEERMADNIAKQAVSLLTQTSLMRTQYPPCSENKTSFFNRFRKFLLHQTGLNDALHDHPIGIKRMPLLQ